MRIKLAWMLGLLAVANGALMLAAPAAWYAIVPGLSDSGPLNAHFVRDIGAAFLVSGWSLGGSSVTQGRGRPPSHVRLSLHCMPSCI